MSAEHHRPSHSGIRPELRVIPLKDYERLQQEQQLKRKLLRAGTIFAAVVTIGTASGVCIANRLSSSETVEDDATFPEEIVQPGIQVIEGTVLLHPGINIRTSPHAVPSETNIFHRHHTYRGQVLIVTNPEVVSGSSATARLGKEPWISFELESWLGVKERVYVNLGPMTRDFTEINGKEYIVDGVKQGKKAFYKTSDSQRLPITSVSIRQKEALRKGKKAIKPQYGKGVKFYNNIL